MLFLYIQCKDFWIIILYLGIKIIWHKNLKILIKSCVRTVKIQAHICFYPNTSKMRLHRGLRDKHSGKKKYMSSSNVLND